MREDNEALRAYYENTLAVVAQLLGQEVDQKEKDTLYHLLALQGIKEISSGARKLCVAAPLTTIPPDIKITLENLGEYVQVALKNLDDEIRRLFPESDKY